MSGGGEIEGPSVTSLLRLTAECLAAAGGAVVSSTAVMVAEGLAAANGAVVSSTAVMAARGLVVVGGVAVVAVMAAGGLVEAGGAVTAGKAAMAAGDTDARLHSVRLVGLGLRGCSWSNWSHDGSWWRAVDIRVTQP